MSSDTKTEQPGNLELLGQYGLSGVKLSVADFDKSVEFYTKYLGMVKGARFNGWEQGLDWPNPNQGSRIVLVNGSEERVLRDQGFESRRGAAWLMGHVKDVNEVARALKADGYKDVPDTFTYDAGNGRTLNLLFVKDPDGNLLQLMH